jgi:hypothetical protein
LNRQERQVCKIQLIAFSIEDCAAIDLVGGLSEADFALRFFDPSASETPPTDSLATALNNSWRPWRFNLLDALDLLRPSKTSAIQLQLAQSTTRANAIAVVGLCEADVRCELA